MKAAHLRDSCLPSVRTGGRSVSDQHGEIRQFNGRMGLPAVGLGQALGWCDFHRRLGLVQLDACEVRPEEMPTGSEACFVRTEIQVTSVVGLEPEEALGVELARHTHSAIDAGLVCRPHGAKATRRAAFQERRLAAAGNLGVCLGSTGCQSPVEALPSAEKERPHNFQLERMRV